jgi:aspartate ammonia-lyase
MPIEKTYRIEHDALGEMSLTAGALHGIHTARALANFALAGRPVRRTLVHAYGMVKLACAQANRDLGYLDGERFDAVAAACRELARGLLDEHVVVDAFQGGAGTSTNMNVNEVIANRALVLMGRETGDYATIDPIEDVNRHQSTNDTFPTAVRVAAILEARALEAAMRELLEAFQSKEHEFADIVKVARTELQDATLTTLGRSMSAYADALARDRWRISKCEERLRVVNLGGTAIGTGLGAPRRFIFAATDILRQLTGIGLARAENGIDATQNVDAMVETSGFLKTHATTLLKIANDLRLLSSGPESGFGEIDLPPRQAGSSIMPGKVNPVIPEAAAQAAIVAIGQDASLTMAAAMGNLELSQFMPLIADALLGQMEILREADDMLARHCVTGMTANAGRCRDQVANGTAAATALVEKVGYRAASAAIALSQADGVTLREAVVGAGLLSDDEYDDLVSPESATRLGSADKETK